MGAKRYVEAHPDLLETAAAKDAKATAPRRTTYVGEEGEITSVTSY